MSAHADDTICTIRARARQDSQRTALVLVHARAQGHLVVLDDEDGRDLQDAGQVDALVEGGGLGGAVAHPGEGHARLSAPAEGERHARDHRHLRRH